MQAMRGIVKTFRRPPTGLATPPFASLFPSPRGVGKACRWAAIAGASLPADETGKAIVWVHFS